MPYTPQGRRKEVIADRKRATESGDWNLLYSTEYLDAFIEKPCYDTIHRIGRAAIDPTRLPGVDALECFLTVNGVSALDRREAREEAMAEFRRRVVAKYEDQCIIKNGDLEKFIQAERVIQEKFATAVK